MPFNTIMFAVSEGLPRHAGVVAWRQAGDFAWPIKPDGDDCGTIRCTALAAPHNAGTARAGEVLVDHQVGTRWSVKRPSPMHLPVFLARKVA